MTERRTSEISARAAECGPAGATPSAPPTPAELYDRHAAALWAYARLLSGSGVEAEDVVQSCIARLAQHVEKLAAAADPKAYLFAALRHEALRQRSRWRRWRHGDAAAGDVPIVADASAGAEAADEARRVRRAVNALPPAQREVVFLKVWHEMTFAAIGGLHGISANTAASRYRYAMEKLRARLET
jgi:RNA polymerase sigma-70 factor (ECF subfamily)